MSKWTTAHTKTGIPSLLIVHFGVYFLTLIFFFLAKLCSLWDLSSLNRYGSVTPAVEKWSLNRWIPREVPTLIFCDDNGNDDADDEDDIRFC